MGFSVKCAILIVLSGLVVGLMALKGAWHFDDFYTIVRNDALRDPSNLLRALYDPALFSVDPERQMFRPLLAVSYILNFLLFGESVRWFLAVNLALHIMNALLAWRIAGRLLGDENGAGALAAGLIYAAHPAASEGVAYASARSAVMASSFVLAAFLYYIKWQGGKSPRLLAVALFCFTLGLMSKAIAIVLPALVILYHLWFPAGVENARRSVLGAALVSALGIIYVVGRRFVMGVVLARSLVRPIDENIYTQARAMMHYLRLYLWPAHQSINPYFPTYLSLFEPQVLASIAALGAIIGIAFQLRLKSGGKGRSASFGALWLLICFTPESTIVPLNLVVSERRMILPLFGFALALGTIAGGLKGNWRKFAVAAITICLASLTIVRLNQWRSEESVWRAAVRVDPGWGLLWNNLGLIYLEKPDTTRATRMFELAARHDPGFKEARLNLGHLYARSGDNETARRYYSEALAIDPGYAKAALYLAQAMNESGNKAAAREFLRTYSIKYPSSRLFHLLGLFAIEDGDSVSAGDYFRKAIALDHDDPLPNLELAKLLIANGNEVGAAEILRAFLKLYSLKDRYADEAVELLKLIGSDE